MTKYTNFYRYPDIRLMPEILKMGTMVKQPPFKIMIEGAESSTMQPPNIGNEPLHKAKPEDFSTSNVKKLVRKLTKKVKPSKKNEVYPPAEQESAEDKLAGFMNKNPKLYVPEKEEPKQASLEIPDPVVRTLSRRQRLLERLEQPLIVDPTPKEEIEEQEKAKETMRQTRVARFRNRLEDYL